MEWWCQESTHKRIWVHEWQRWGLHTPCLMWMQTNPASEAEGNFGRGGFWGIWLLSFYMLWSSAAAAAAQREREEVPVQKFILFISDLLLNTTQGILIGIEVRATIQLSKYGRIHSVLAGEKTLAEQHNKNLKWHTRNLLLVMVDIYKIDWSLCTITVYILVAQVLIISFLKSTQSQYYTYTTHTI